MGERNTTYLAAGISSGQITLESQLETIKSAFDALGPIFSQIAEAHAATQEILRNLDLERLRRTIEIVQTFKAIELDLAPYDDVPIEQLIASVYYAKPCEYKEILERKFLADGAPAQSHEAATLANRLLVIFLATLKIYRVIGFNG